MDIRVAQALHMLGLLTPAQQQQVALDALESGSDSPALRRLAGLLSDEMAEAPRLFAAVTVELALAALSTHQAATAIGDYVAGQIVAGQTTPEEGAAQLWEVSLRLRDPSFHDFDPFIYALSELQSRPGDREFFRQAIVSEAWSVVAAGAG